MVWLARRSVRGLADTQHLATGTAAHQNTVHTPHPPWRTCPQRTEPPRAGLWVPIGLWPCPLPLPPPPPELPLGEPSPSCARRPGPRRLGKLGKLCSEFILEEQLHSEAQPPSWGVHRSPLCPLGTGASWRPSAGLVDASCRPPGAWTLPVCLHAHLHTAHSPFLGPRRLSSRDWCGAAGNLQVSRI